MRVKGCMKYIILICVLLSSLGAHADTIDIGAMDFVFDRFDGLSKVKKALAYEYMEGAMHSEASLEGFKKTADWLLNEDRLALLEKNGIDRSDIMQNLDALKTWTRKDRFALVDAFKAGDMDAIVEINEKYGDEPLPEDPGAIPILAVTTVKDTFTDMAGHWAREAVQEMAAIGIVKGKGNGVFDPEARVTRAEFVALLVRLAETRAPIAESAALLIDVPPGSWYESAIRKAYLSGILRGDGKGNMHPGQGINRQEMAVMAVNLSKHLGIKLPGDSGLSSFTDSGQIAPWARESLAAARAAGWINGMGNKRMEPEGPVTRAQAATILKRIYETTNQ